MAGKICEYFVRPPRQTYLAHDLGPRTFTIPQGQTTLLCQRTEFAVLSPGNLRLCCTLFHRKSKASNECVVYLHTHHGSKLEGLALVEQLLRTNINVCLFDFGGYGNSEGHLTSLGIRQSQDIQLVLSKLSVQFGQEKFFLWGRSMGAGAAILHLAQGPRQNFVQIVGAAFDSPFYSLEKLVLQIGSKTTGLPEALLVPFVYWLRKSLEGQLDFAKLELLEQVRRVQVPGCFIASKSDRLVECSHSQKLYEKYGGAKQLIYIDKDHNEPRSNQELADVYKFIRALFVQASRSGNQAKFLTIMSNNWKIAEVQRQEEQALEAQESCRVKYYKSIGILRLKRGKESPTLCEVDMNCNPGQWPAAQKQKHPNSDRTARLRKLSSVCR